MNPVWVQAPVPSVVTAAGVPPEPLRRVKASDTPESAVPPLSTFPDTVNVVGAVTLSV